MKPSRVTPTEARLSAVIDASSEIDPTVKEILERTVRLMVRCGFHPNQIETLTKKVCRQVPAKHIRADANTEFSYEDASHILTIWYTDPKYLSPAGKPVLLPARGSVLSIEALLRLVNPTLDLEGSIQYLIRVRALRKEGDLYAIDKRWTIFHGLQDPTNARNLHVLRGILRTLEHNVRAKDMADGLLERVATNPSFPVGALRAFKNQVLDPQAQQFLETVDDAMQRRADSSASDERRTRLYCGVYVFTDPIKPNRAMTKRRDSRSIRLAKNKPRRPKTIEESSLTGEGVGRLDHLIQGPKPPRS